MAELRRVDLGHGQGYCSLEEALDGFGETRFNIDVKVEAAVAATVDAVQRTRAGRTRAAHELLRSSTAPRSASSCPTP